MNHPYSGSANMLLPRGSDMYDEAVGLQRRANAPKPTADEQMLATGMEACAGISSLSPGAEMKCEIRAHQMAVKPGK